MYYFHDATGSPELDFLFEKDGNTVIIECKASNNRATSMKFVLANPKRFGLHPAVKIADTNVGTTNDFDTLPYRKCRCLQKLSDSVNVMKVRIISLS